MCIHCGWARSIRKGRRRTKQLGVRQIRLCKKCGRKFTPRNQQPLPSDDAAPAVEPFAAQAADNAEDDIVH